MSVDLPFLVLFRLLSCNIKEETELCTVRRRTRSSFVGTKQFVYIILTTIDLNLCLISLLALYVQIQAFSKENTD